VVGELIAVELALVASLGDAQDHAFAPAAETPHHGPRINIPEIPGPDRLLDWFKDAVFPDAFGSAEDDRVVDLLIRLFDAVSEAVEEVFGIVGVDLPHVIDPDLGLSRISNDRQGLGRVVEVKGSGSGAGHPAARGEEPVSDDLLVARRPCHLFNGPVLGEIRGRGDQDRFALLVCSQLNLGQAHVGVRRRPDCAGRRKDTAALLGHEEPEVF